MGREQRVWVPGLAEEREKTPRSLKMGKKKPSHLLPGKS